jgi:hypothetical protein
MSCFDHRRPLLASLLALACLLTGHAALAEERYIPRDLPACAADKPASGYDTVCKEALTAAEVAGALDKLEDRGFAYAVEGDTLLVALRAQGADLRYPAGPRVCCDIQAYLDKVGADAYAAKFRWNRMSAAMLDIRFLGMDHRPDARVQINGSPQFVTAYAGGNKDIFTRHGFFIGTEQVDGGTIIGLRKVTVATGPLCHRSLAQCSVIYMPDGESTRAFVGGALTSGVDMRNVVVVGLHGVEVNGNEVRMEELLFALGGPRYASHMRFVTEDLRRHVEGARTPGHRLSAGYSNGGAWAADALLAHPELFDGAIVMSPAMWKFRNDDKLRGHRVFIGAGFMEPRFRASALTIVAGLKERGATVQELYIPSGHSMNTWTNIWNAALRDLANPVR